MSESWDNKHNPEDRFVEITDLPVEQEEPGKPKRNTRKLWLGSSLTRKQKRRRLLWTSGIVLGLLLIFLASLAPVRELVVNSLTGENTLSPNTRNLYFVQLLPGWGTLTIDGKAYAPLPTTLNGRPIQLAAGKHKVRWVGEPFEPLQCTLVVASQDLLPRDEQPCQTSKTENNLYQAILIRFPQTANLHHMPASEQGALKDAVQRFLDEMRASETVQAGEQYKLDHDAKETLTASQNLHATRSFQLDTDSNQPAQCEGPTVGPDCTLDTQDCRLFCTVPVGNDHSVSDTKYWDAFTVVREHWEFQALNNTKTRQQSRLNERFLLLLRITREHGQWHIAFQPQGYSGFNNPACTLTMGTIFNDNTYRQFTKTQQRVSWQFAGSTNTAAGCVMAGHLYANGGSVPNQAQPGQADAYLITRFNVLQAGNEKAHELWPDLPRANIHTRQIINDIVRQPKTVS